MRPPVIGVLALQGDVREHLAVLRAHGAEAVTAIMPEMGREVAWNMAVHNGVAGGLYVEVLPYTQERGGYEMLGLNLCEGTPFDIAGRLRDYFGV